ncbi:hypothetical protein DXG01_010906 [Tephrocybe rancida]|nr:hypothetical protein DXG01_010906 [Tephrocybe rancida]
MASERTPLIASSQDRCLDADAVYERFSSRNKLAILGMVSWCGLLPLFITGSFVPLVPQIASDLESSGEVVSLAFSLAVFAAGLGSLGGGSYSTYYGRRPVYLFGLSLSAIGSLGMALSQSIPVLMVFRFCQTLGASPAMTVGAGVIGDIYVREQRGTAMGVFLASILLGPTLAPLVGGEIIELTFNERLTRSSGLAAHYASWRIMQFALCASGVLALLLMYGFFPETSHPNSRGIDMKKAESLGLATSNVKFINPLQALSLLQSPVVLGIGKRYGISNEAILGACFLPNGLGDISQCHPHVPVAHELTACPVGAPLAGRLSDVILARSRKERSGVWCPEDRIKGTLFSAATLVPISVLSFGLVNKYVGGTTGLSLTLICLFVNGAGVQMVLGPTAAYLIDIMPSRSAETVAASTPNVSQRMLWAIVRYGDRLRAWNDIGFASSAHL